MQQSTAIMYSSAPNSRVALSVAAQNQNAAYDKPLRVCLQARLCCSLLRLLGRKQSETFYAKSPASV